MNDLPRQKLAEMIAKYGRDLADDPMRCQGLLRDLCPSECKLEINLLVSALREGVPTDLLASSATPKEVRFALLRKRLQENLGLADESARWAVESWATAMGIATPEDLRIPFNCPACGASGSAASRVAGKSVECPKCGSTIRISADGRTCSLETVGLPIGDVRSGAREGRTQPRPTGGATTEVKTPGGPPSAPDPFGNAPTWLKQDSTQRRQPSKRKRKARKPEGPTLFDLEPETQHAPRKEATTFDDLSSDDQERWKALHQQDQEYSWLHVPKSMRMARKLRLAVQKKQRALDEAEAAGRTDEAAAINKELYDDSGLYKQWEQASDKFLGDLSKKWDTRIQKRKLLNNDVMNDVNYSHDPVTNSIGMKLVLIEPGEFMMGSPHSDNDASCDEKPEHRVRITRPFYLGVFPVTQAEYERIMGTNPSRFRGDPKRPVENVSWHDTVEFCRRLSALPQEKGSGHMYRLPTEAEWEYACRAGTTTRYYFGDDNGALSEYAWFRENSKGQTHPVGQKKPNAWGLYDMYGNVSELCADWYGDDYYGRSPSKNPIGPSSGDCRVARGASWATWGRVPCSAFRCVGFVPDHRDDDAGFRVACTL